MVSVNIANTNFTRVTILDYVFWFFTFSHDVLSQEFDLMIYKSFSGVENVIPYPIHTDVAVGCPLLRLTYSKIAI